MASVIAAVAERGAFEQVVLDAGGAGARCGRSLAQLGAQRP